MDLASMILGASSHTNQREHETDSQLNHQPAAQRPTHEEEENRHRRVELPAQAHRKSKHQDGKRRTGSEKLDSSADSAADCLKRDEAPPLPRYDLLYSLNGNHNTSSGPQEINWANTPVEIAERQAPPRVYSTNRLRQREWQQIRKRWQLRKHDFRQEDDVGNAVAIQVRVQQSRQLLAASLKKKQQNRRSKRKRSDDSFPVDIFPRILHVSREAELFSQLTQRNDQDQDQLHPSPQNETLPPYKETLNYWEYGLHAPSENEAIIHDPMARAPSSWTDSGAIRETAALKRQKGNKTQSSTKAWQLQSFQRPIYSRRLTSELMALHNDPVRSCPLTVQRRQIFRAAARYLVAAAGTAEPASVSLGARWIRILWKLRHRRAFASALPLPELPQQIQSAYDRSMSARQVWNDATLLSDHQCRRTGSFLYKFLTHTWTNRAAAADRLFGLQQPLVMAPPGPESDWVGLSMEPKEKDSLEQNVWSECRLRYSHCCIHRNQEQQIEWNPVAGSVMSSDTEPGTALLEPTTHYVHLPGTRPPTPCFPYDIIPMQFGPSDRNEQVMHGGSIDAGVYKLTLATLLTRLAATVVAARTISPSGDDDSDDNNDSEQQHRQERAITGLQQQLRAVLEQTVRLNQNKFYERLRRNTRMDAMKLPLAFFYRSLATYCSVVANGVPVPIHGSLAAVSRKDDASDHDVDSTDDGDGFDGLAMAPSLQTVVKRLFEMLDVHLEHNGLQMFAELHTTFGILRLAHRLPAHSLQLLSRPLEWDSTTFSKILTPFDIIRDVLEDLEQRDMLVDHVAGILGPGALDNDRESGVPIYAGELEYSLHRASIIFAHCVEQDPTQIIYQAWHLAAVAGSLLLCSGHYIGFSTSHPYPSGRTTSYNDDDGMNNNANSAPHEARRYLPKFNDLRRETVIVFRRLAHLARHQRGNRAHRLLATFLEWRQVMALLLGPPHSTEEIGRDRSCYRNIRELHRYHCTEWAREERTATAFESVLSTGNDQFSNIIDCDNPDDRTEEKCRLHGLACALESDPSSLHHWRALVTALGPVRRRLPEKSQDSQEPDSILSEVVAADFVREDSADGWWGYERKWWHDCLLQPPNVTTVVNRVSKDRADKIISEIQRTLVNIEPVISDADEAGSKMDRTSREPPSLTWLENFLMCQLNEKNSDDETTPQPVKLRSRSVDQYLPWATRQPDQRAASSSSPNPMLPLDLIAGNDAGHSAELLAYKALILSHLCNESHESVNRLVFILVHASLNETGLSNRDSASRCVQWLYQMGLDVTTGYRQVLLQPAKFKLDGSSAAAFLKSRRHRQFRAIFGKRKRAEEGACVDEHEERSTAGLGSTENGVTAAARAKKAKQLAKAPLKRRKKMSSGRVKPRKNPTAASHAIESHLGSSSMAPAQPFLASDSSFQLLEEELPVVFRPTQDEHAGGMITFEI